ncbi:MAG TPA: hypothetical protein PK867_05865 [Pirellulales bacterium]|nr:hypothetical protein [Pirellulales bacterium]
MTLSAFEELIEHVRGGRPAIDLRIAWACRKLSRLCFGRSGLCGNWFWGRLDRLLVGVSVSHIDLARFIHVNDAGFGVADLGVAVAQPLTDVELLLVAVAVGFGRPRRGFLDAFDLGALFGDNRSRKEHLEFKGTNCEMVALLQLALADDPLAIDDGAVFAAKIPYGDEALFDQQHAMVPADQVASRPKLAVFGPANKELGPRNGKFLSRVLPN